MNIGFSTGSLAKGNFKAALHMLSNIETNVIELSALREDELIPLIEELENLDLRAFIYKSVHAPSKLVNFTEEYIVSQLQRIAQKGWYIVVHPDIIKNFSLWETLSEYLCLENMDKRKPLGRTAEDMRNLFRKLPLASFCFDIAHAKQVDPTLLEGLSMIREFKDRLVQVHISEVNTDSRHQALNFDSILAFSTLAKEIPLSTPIVIESPLIREQLQREIDKVRMIFDPTQLLHMILPLKNSSLYFYNKVNELDRLVNI